MGDRLSLTDIRRTLTHPGWRSLLNDSTDSRKSVLIYVIFDVLILNGESLMQLPYSERRSELEVLNLNGPYWQTPETFEGGAALFEAVRGHGLEGIAAKRLNGRYRPGERGWIKIKNREYWRYELERESAINKRRQRMFVWRGGSQFPPSSLYVHGFSQRCPSPETT